MKRRTARENAFIVLFEMSFDTDTLEGLIATSRELEEYAVDEYGEAILINYEAHRREVDELITSNLKDWTLARLPRTSSAVLRLAVTEMLYANEDMDSIVINEAVEIAKIYCAEEDYQFINGILGTIQRNKPEAQASEEQ
ncbi:MAG: transcription antitermination factor NusB [Oscillospiraceae bacterium]